MHDMCFKYLVTECLKTWDIRCLFVRWPSELKAQQLKETNANRPNKQTKKTFPTKRKRVPCVDLSGKMRVCFITDSLVFV